MNLESSPYSVAPIEYYKRYKRNVEIHNATQDKSYLFYGALELRYAIESVLFYYLWILNNGNLSKQQQNIWHAKNLKNEILDIDPYFPYRLDFIRVLAYMDSDLGQTVKPDFDLLANGWARLGAYLHAHKVVVVHRLPEDYWIDFAKVLDAPARNLSLVLSRPFVNLQFSPEGNSIIEKYATGQISWEAVVAEFEPRWGRIFQSVSQYIHEA